MCVDVIAVCRFLWNEYSKLLYSAFVLHLDVIPIPFILQPSASIERKRGFPCIHLSNLLKQAKELCYNLPSNHEVYEVLNINSPMKKKLNKQGG